MVNNVNFHFVKWKWNHFYALQHICYSAYMLSPIHLSVRRVDHTKTVEDRIMKFSPYGSPIPLVFREQVSYRNSQGFPTVGALNEGGVGKIGDFRPLSRHISETVQDRTVYTRFPLVPKSMTLSDPMTRVSRSW